MAGVQSMGPTTGTAMMTTGLSCEHNILLCSLHLSSQHSHTRKKKRVDLGGEREPLVVGEARGGGHAALQQRDLLAHDARGNGVDERQSGTQTARSRHALREHECFPGGKGGARGCRVLTCASSIRGTLLKWHWPLSRHQTMSAGDNSKRTSGHVLNVRGWVNGQAV